MPPDRVERNVRGCMPEQAYNISAPEFVQFGNCSDGHARDGVAFADDLIDWRKANQILVDVGLEGSIDSRHAHKPGIISKDGKLYHFYCAVAPARDKLSGEIEHNEVRGIALATS